MLSCYVALISRFRSHKQKSTKLDFGDSARCGKITALGGGSGGGRVYPFDDVLKRLLAASLLGFVQKPLYHADDRLPWFTFNLSCIFFWGDGGSFTGHELYVGQIRGISKALPKGYANCSFYCLPVIFYLLCD